MLPLRIYSNNLRVRTNPECFWKSQLIQWPLNKKTQRPLSSGLRISTPKNAYKRSILHNFFDFPGIAQMNKVSWSCSLEMQLFSIFYIMCVALHMLLFNAMEEIV